MALSPTSSHGGGPFLTATTQVSAAQIQALNDTAVQLLPAVAGALVLPVSVTWIFSPIGTTAYTVPGALYVDVANLRAAPGAVFLVPTGLAALLQTSPVSSQIAADDFLAALQGMFGAADVVLAAMVNQPVMLRTDTGNPTLGDSGLKAVIVYQVVAP